MMCSERDVHGTSCNKTIMLSTNVIAGLCGALTWSLLEYVIHRWMAHGRGFWRATPFGQEHTRHHAEGNYFAPSWKKAGTALLTMAFVAPLSIVLTNLVTGLVFASAFVFTYVAHEVHHRRIHTHASDSAYGRWARQHHLHHHFVDSRTNHGVTSPLWDFVFRTYRKPQTIPVPRRLCMKWLVDPRTGNVLDDYADMFVVRETPGSAAH